MSQEHRRNLIRAALYPLRLHWWKNYPKWQKRLMHISLGPRTGRSKVSYLELAGCKSSEGKPPQMLPLGDIQNCQNLTDGEQELFTGQNF